MLVEASARSPCRRRRRSWTGPPSVSYTHLAIAVFGVSGNILWGLALCIGVANLAGGFLGSRTALRNGNAFVRKVFLAMIVILGAKLAWDTIAQFV